MQVRLLILMNLALISSLVFLKTSRADFESKLCEGKVVYLQAQSTIKVSSAIVPRTFNIPSGEYFSACYANNQYYIPVFDGIRSINRATVSGTKVVIDPAKKIEIKGVPSAGENGVLTETVIDVRDTTNANIAYRYTTKDLQTGIVNAAFISPERITLSEKTIAPPKYPIPAPVSAPVSKPAKTTAQPPPQQQIADIPPPREIQLPHVSSANKVPDHLKCLPREGYKLKCIEHLKSYFYYANSCNQNAYEDYNDSYFELIKDAGDNFGIPHTVLGCLMFQESKFDNKAKSRTSVKGIVQMTADTRAFVADFLLLQHDSIKHRKPDRVRDIKLSKSYNAMIANYKSAASSKDVPKNEIEDIAYYAVYLRWIMDTMVTGQPDGRKASDDNKTIPYYAAIAVAYNQGPGKVVKELVHNGEQYPVDQWINRIKRDDPDNSIDGQGKMHRIRVQKCMMREDLRKESDDLSIRNGNHECRCKMDVCPRSLTELQEGFPNHNVRTFPLPAQGAQ